jgi:N-carbamoyl-L-amino-acid hydrolase
MTSATPPPAAQGQTQKAPIPIRPERLLADLHALRAFGATGSGVVRPALSQADVRSRAWLAGRYQQAGLTPVADRCGNVFGCDRTREHAILIGSHSDTQPAGGWLDGAMGVIYGLEIARAVNESGLSRSVGVDAVSWNDEEGRFGHFLGSRAYCGLLPPSELEAAVDVEGVRLVDAIAQAGYADLPMRPVDPTRHLAYLEGHIEQGPVLDACGDTLAAVSAIVGAREFVVTFTGEANHAGTTPMAQRKDAVRALMHFLAALDLGFGSIADGKIVWTFGRIEVTPNAPSIVPAAASASVQFRAPDLIMLDRFEQIMHETLASAVGVAGVTDHQVRQILDYIPTPMDPRLTAMIARAADQIAPGRARTLHSGAGHDAQFLAPIMPTGMLFIPSIGGISHSLVEDTAEADIVAGCEALAVVVAELLAEIG